MKGYWENQYANFMSTDNDLCVPLLRQEEIASILDRVRSVADSIVGEGNNPKIFFDLEHLQITDYVELPPNTSEQKEAIQKIQKTNPVRLDEMAYLALRSMIGFSWDKPQSENEIQRAAAYESALGMVLTEVSSQVSDRYDPLNSPLPYWGRLAFLRVMTGIPDEQIEAMRLQKVSCTLLKDPVFNARSFQFDEHGIVALNFALEPILKNLNRMLLHFFHTQSMAGPKRMERAWQDLMPVVAYFWTGGAVPTNHLSGHSVLFDQTMAEHAQALTASQVDFIIRHELGHLVLDHARRLKAITDNSEARVALQKEFEFSADAFAHGNHRSELYNHLRINLQWDDGPSNDSENNNKALQSLHSYQADISGVRLLFIYMDAIDQAGQMLKRRLGGSIRFRTKMDTHPSPRERLERLDSFNLGEHHPTSELIRYAIDFFSKVIEYAEGLEDADLAAPMRDYY